MNHRLLVSGILVIIGLALIVGPSIPGAIAGEQAPKAVSVNLYYTLMTPIGATQEYWKSALLTGTWYTEPVDLGKLGSKTERYPSSVPWLPTIWKKIGVGNPWVKCYKLVAVKVIALSPFKLTYKVYGATPTTLVGVNTVPQRLPWKLMLENQGSISSREEAPGVYTAAIIVGSTSGEYTYIQMQLHGNGWCSQPINIVVKQGVKVETLPEAAELTVNGADVTAKAVVVNTTTITIEPDGTMAFSSSGEKVGGGGTVTLPGGQAYLLYNDYHKISGAVYIEKTQEQKAIDIARLAAGLLALAAAAVVAKKYGEGL